MNILDFIFPKRCVICKKSGSYLCENCFIKLSFDAKSLCLICNKPSYNGLTHPFCQTKYSIDGCFSALSYNKTVQKLIFSFKYKPYLSDLKTVLSDLFYESIIQNENFNNELKKGEWVFIPIPLSSSKLRKRGYNQSDLLGKTLSLHLNLPYGSKLLIRKRETKPQFELKREERFANMKGAFTLSAKYKERIKGKTILIVDDIVTTGSTLAECGKILKKAGASKVLGLALAHEV